MKQDNHGLDKFIKNIFGLKNFLFYVGDTCKSENGLKELEYTYL